MAYPSVSNVFVNGSVGDANQVNTNFSDLVNGLSDGTKNLLVKTGSFASGVETPYLTATSAVVGGVLTAAQVSSPSGVFGNASAAFVSCYSGVFGYVSATKVSAPTAAFGRLDASEIVCTGKVYTNTWENLLSKTTFSGWDGTPTGRISGMRIGNLAIINAAITCVVTGAGVGILNWTLPTSFLAAIPLTILDTVAVSATTGPLTYDTGGMTYITASGPCTRVRVYADSGNVYVYTNMVYQTV